MSSFRTITFPRSCLLSLPLALGAFLSLAACGPADSGYAPQQQASAIGPTLELPREKAGEPCASRNPEERANQGATAEQKCTPNASGGDRPGNPLRPGSVVCVSRYKNGQGQWQEALVSQSGEAITFGVAYDTREQCQERRTQGGTASPAENPSGMRGYGKTMDSPQMQQTLDASSGTGPKSGTGVLGSTNPLDLMNRLRQATALDEATPPRNAIDEALSEYQSSPKQQP